MPAGCSSSAPFHHHHPALARAASHLIFVQGSRTPQLPDSHNPLHHVRWYTPGTQLTGLSSTFIAHCVGPHFSSKPLASHPCSTRCACWFGRWASKQGVRVPCRSHQDPPANSSILRIFCSARITWCGWHNPGLFSGCIRWCLTQDDHAAPEPGLGTGPPLLHRSNAQRANCPYDWTVQWCTRLLLPDRA